MMTMKKVEKIQKMMVDEESQKIVENRILFFKTGDVNISRTRQSAYHNILIEIIIMEKKKVRFW